VPQLPFSLSEGQVKVGAQVPRLGEHSEQVLAELAGLSGDTLRAVVERGRRK
jgi:crotonobetainyl-CoA:carnitine CoA-transferase CaiB-like acyl-CoA transferase